MKKLGCFFILMVLIISFSATNAFAQTLQTSAYVGDLKSIDDSKYRATAVTIIRNSDGELLSVATAIASRYLDDPILDEFLNSDPKYLVKQGRMNNQDVNLYNIKVGFQNPQCIEKIYEIPGFNDNCNWYHRAFSTLFGLTDSEGVHQTVLRGLNHGEVIRSGYDVDIIWNIITRN